MNQKLISWSKDHYSHLPWRENRSLYGTLVSEIMLQQTTVGTVLNHFEKFMSKYPTIEDLAQISEEQMLIQWKGLGYYRRARNLLGAAKQIQNAFSGEIPLDYETLISIKGVGPYTASAILGIGADKPALAIDANLERVLARIHGIEIPKGPKLQKEIEKRFKNGEIGKELNQFGARAYNEALMDLGRSICKARSAACEICPVSRECAARVEGEPLKYPVNIEKNQTKTIGGVPLSLLRVVVEKNGKILAYKKNESEWLSNQYEIPTFILDSDDENLSQYPKVELNHLKLLPSFKTGITKYKIDNFVLFMSEKEFIQNIGKFDRYQWLEDKSHLSTSSIKSLNI